MWTLLSNYFWIVPLLIAIPYVGFPLIVLATFRLKYPTTVLPLDLDESDLPSDISDFIIPVSGELEALGFLQIGCFGLPDLTPNAVSCNSLLINEKTKEAAMVSCICGTGSGAGLKTKYVEFVSKFADGHCIQTNNSRELSAFRDRPQVQTNKFWEVNDARKLYQLHTQIAARLGTGRLRLTLYDDFDGDLDAYINHCAIRDPCDYQIEIGLLRGVAGGYAATFRGAYWLVWQELWPFKGMRRLAAWHKARRWLTALSVGTMSHGS